jgi:predicted HicB family RNase H-like nuclease
MPPQRSRHLVVRLDEGLHRRLVEHADRNDRSTSNAAARLIRSKLDVMDRVRPFGDDTETRG